MSNFQIDAKGYEMLAKILPDAGKFVPNNTYKTKNGFEADIRYIYQGMLCGHVDSECGFAMLHWDFVGKVMGADPGFDLVDALEGEG